MCRDPRDYNLILLEANGTGVVGADWQSRLEKVFLETLGKFRKYDGKSVQDLMRALRNKVSSTSLVWLLGMVLIGLVLETPLPGSTGQCEEARWAYA